VQLSANNYPAIYAAMNYGTATYGGVTNAAPTSTTTNPNSGWYLPSFGQWFLIFKNIGGFNDVTSSTKDLGKFLPLQTVLAEQLFVPSSTIISMPRQHTTVRHRQLRQLVLFGSGHLQRQTKRMRVP
jgi:hypothetical protein